MDLDSGNHVVALCVEGMEAEGRGDNDQAASLFRQAWDARRDDVEACIAAHYFARQQSSPEDVLRWNREALDLAEAVARAGAGERVATFYPSLHLNLGHSHEVLGDLTEARRQYELAASRLDALPPGPYTDMVRHGVTEGRARVTQPPSREQGTPSER